MVAAVCSAYGGIQQGPRLKRHRTRLCPVHGCVKLELSVLVYAWTAWVRFCGNRFEQTCQASPKLVATPPRPESVEPVATSTRSCLRHSLRKWLRNEGSLHTSLMSTSSSAKLLARTVRKAGAPSTSAQAGQGGRVAAAAQQRASWPDQLRGFPTDILPTAY